MEKNGSVSSHLRKTTTVTQGHRPTTQGVPTDRPPGRLPTTNVSATDAADDAYDLWLENIVAVLLTCLVILWVGLLLYFLSMSLWVGSKTRLDLAPMLLAAVVTFALQTGDINGWIGLHPGPSLLIEGIKGIFVFAFSGSGDDAETASFVLHFLVLIYVLSAGSYVGPERFSKDPSLIILRLGTIFGLMVIVYLCLSHPGTQYKLFSVK